MDEAEQRRIDAGNAIDLKWLRSFVVVAEEASFTRAASRVHVAQPGSARRSAGWSPSSGSSCWTGPAVRSG